MSLERSPTHPPERSAAKDHKGPQNNTKLNYACDASVDAWVSVICDRVPSSNASIAASRISSCGLGASRNQGLISTNPRGNSDFALMGSTSLFIKTCASKFKRPSIWGLAGRVRCCSLDTVEGISRRSCPSLGVDFHTDKDVLAARPVPARRDVRVQEGHV